MGAQQRDYRAIYCTAGDAPDVVEAFSAFRKRLFIDILRWDLVPRGRFEIDAFDTDAACYCALYSGADIVGGFRAIGTMEPYLGQQVFPALASLHPFPQRRDVWEISRFGVLPGHDRIVLARVNYALMFRFAFLRGATSLVAVADLKHERLLAAFGIRSARYGPPQALARDADGRPMPVVAGEIRLAEQQGPRFQALIDHARLVEIQDETSVFGRDRISA